MNILNEIQNKAILDFSSKKEKVIKDRMIALGIEIPKKPSIAFYNTIEGNETTYWYKEQRIITFIEMPMNKNYLDDKTTMSFSIEQKYY